MEEKGKGGGGWRRGSRGEGILNNFCHGRREQARRQAGWAGRPRQEQAGEWCVVVCAAVGSSRPAPAPHRYHLHRGTGGKVPLVGQHQQRVGAALHSALQPPVASCSSL